MKTPINFNTTPFSTRTIIYIHNEARRRINTALISTYETRVRNAMAHFIWNKFHEKTVFFQKKKKKPSHFLMRPDPLASIVLIAYHKIAIMGFVCTR